MATGNTKGTMWVCSINYPKKDLLEQPNEKTLEEWEEERLIPYLKGYQKTLLSYNQFGECHTQIHDKDIYSKEDAPTLQDIGQHKKTHLHAWFTTNEVTKGALLRLLAEIMNCKKEQISLEPTLSECLGVQYLTHKNDQEKHQYPFEEIQTTNAEKLEYRYSMKYEEQESESERIRKAVFNAQNLTELCDQVGIENTRKYMGLFDRIRTEKEAEKKTAEEIGQLMQQLAGAHQLIEELNTETSKQQKEIDQIHRILAVYRRNEIDAVRLANALCEWAETGYLPYDIQRANETFRKKKQTKKNESK